MAKRRIKDVLKGNIDLLIEESINLKDIIKRNYKELTYEELERFIKCNYLMEKDVFLLRATEKEFSSRRLIRIHLDLENNNNGMKELVSKYNLI